MLGVDTTFLVEVEVVELAATYHAAGITGLLSTNARDFTPFGVFDVVKY